MRSLVAGLKSGERGCGNELGGDEEHEAVGQRDEAIANDDEGLAVGVVGGGELVAEAELAAELRAGGFLADEGVGAALEDCAVDGLGCDGTAEARLRLIERVGTSRPSVRAFCNS